MVENFQIISQILWAFFAFSIVLSVLVFVHEMGHYLVARWNGVRVEVFSIGFGPEIFGWTSSSGTRWKFSWIPLGGYVKMFGDATEASTPDQTLYNFLSEEDKNQTLLSKSPLQKISVAVAGPVANLLLAFFLFLVVFAFHGYVSNEPIVGEVDISSPSYNILEPGDRIVGFESGKSPVKNFSDIQNYIQPRGGIPTTVVAERQGRLHTFSITPAVMHVSNTFSVGVLGVKPQLVSLSFTHSIIYAGSSVIDTSINIFKTLGRVFTSSSSAKQLGSILSIAKMSKESLEGGIFLLFSFMAILSINLGVINLLPVPVLDGGHIFIHSIELLIGRPLSYKVQDILFKIGFCILILVMLFTFFNDLERFKIIQFVKNIWLKVAG